MKKLSVSFLVLLLSHVCSVWAGGAKKQSPSSTTGGTVSSDSAEPIERQILVSFEKHMSKNDRKEIFERFDVQEIEQVGKTPLFLVEVKEASRLKSTLEALSKTKGVRYAEPNLKLRIFENKASEPNLKPMIQPIIKPEQK